MSRQLTKEMAEELLDTLDRLEQEWELVSDLVRCHSRGHATPFLIQHHAKRVGLAHEMGYIRDTLKSQGFPPIRMILTKEI